MATRHRGYPARGTRIATQTHGTVTVTAVRRHGQVLIVRDRAGSTWELHRTGRRWHLTAPRAGAR
jgi:hypothetical protein